MPAWYEDEGFWTTFGPALFYEARWRAAEPEAAAVAGLLKLGPGERVLDACCGPGRHCLALARRGVQVTGVDRSAYLLSMAAERAKASGLRVELVNADIRTYRQDRAYDAAINLFTSFGFFEDPADDRRMLQNLAASLKPGGRLVMDMSGKEVIARGFQARAWSEPAPGVYLLEDRTPALGWEYLENRWVLVREGQVVERRFRLRVYSAVELKAVLLSAGFAEVTVYGSLEGGPYDHAARRLVAVASRAGMGGR